MDDKDVKPYSAEFKFKKQKTPDHWFRLIIENFLFFSINGGSLLEGESHLSICVDCSTIHNDKPKAVGKLGVYWYNGVYSVWNRKFL